MSTIISTKNKIEIDADFQGARFVNRGIGVFQIKFQKKNRQNNIEIFELKNKTQQFLRKNAISNLYNS